MAEFRNIHTRIWKDAWFSELQIDEKLLFIYLFSNERASVCGMYELPIKYIAFETGISQERISEILMAFEQSGKAYYQHGVVWVVNLKKYNDSGDSIKVRVRADKDLAAVPDCELKKMYYSKLGIPYPESNIPYPENSSDTDTDTDTEKIRSTSTLSPELALYNEVTGLYPDVTHIEEVERNIRSVQERNHLPREKVKEIMTVKYREWCAARTADGRPYSPSNPKWLEWCITGYTPTPQQPAHTNGRKNRLLPEGI